MTGVYKNNKIEYSTPFVNSLSGGSWETGWSGVQRSGGNTYYYEVLPTDIPLIEGKKYRFELKEEKALIIKRYGTNNE